MKHPILKNRSRIVIYLFLWVLISGFQVMYVFSGIKEPGFALLIVVFLENLVLALLLLGVWFGLRYLKLETQQPLQFLINHLGYLGFLMLGWLALSNLIETLVLGQSLSGYQTKMQPIKILLGVFSYLLFVLYIYLDAYYVSFQEKVENERKLQEILKESELNLLKTQMNPHFIFNSLNSISSLTMLNAEKAQEMIIKLSNFLRYTVNASHEQLVSLEHELEMCQSYLEIEKVRFGEKIEFDFRVEEVTLKEKIPSMMLQTLIENAIKHGVYNSLKKEYIHFSSVLEADRLVLKISNTFDLDSQPKIGAKTGLKNIKERLDLIYGAGAIFTTEVAENKFLATLNLPVKT